MGVEDRPSNRFRRMLSSGRYGALQEMERADRPIPFTDQPIYHHLDVRAILEGVNPEGPFARCFKEALETADSLLFGPSVAPYLDELVAAAEEEGIPIKNITNMSDVPDKFYVNHMLNLEYRSRPRPNP